MKSSSTRISKFLSLVLRHKPELIGIHLDQNGWTDVDILLEKSSIHEVTIDKETLQHVVETNSKKRFAFNENLDKIRASQGHTVNIDLGYASHKPPEMLYHGTGYKSVKYILQSGLKRINRQHVHLSSDVQTAVAVGKRHGKPFVFKVFAEKMYDDKFDFFLSDNGVWLTDNVPIKYLEADIEFEGCT